MSEKRRFHAGIIGRVANQPTNQPTNQPANQPTKQPTNQPTNQPANQPTNQATNQPTNQATNQPTNQPSNQLFPTKCPATNTWYTENYQGVPASLLRLLRLGGFQGADSWIPKAKLSDGMYVTTSLVGEN